MGSERLFECETEFDHYPLSRKEYAVWMSLTIGLSFTWLNILDLYNNDTLFFQKLTISVINNTSFADVIASYLRLILYLPFGLLAIVLTLLFCAQRLCDTRLFVLAWPISLAVFLVFGLLTSLSRASQSGVGR